MELTKQMVKDAIKKKKITELELCKAVNYSQPSLHRFYNSGQIRAKNARRIIEYLELEDINDTKTQVKSSENLGDHGMFERLLKRVEELTIENFTLKKELGKFDSAFLALSA